MSAPGAGAAAAGPAGAAPGVTTGLGAAVEAVGDRWSLLVVDALLSGPLRFVELEAAVEGIATNVLTQRLRHLERARVLVGRPYSRRPLRTAYELTAAGRELGGALRLLAQWGAGPGGGPGAPVHQTCGAALEARWWCPTCDRQVSDPGEAQLYLA